MVLCPKCGTPLNDGAAFCPNCGTAIASNQNPQYQQQYQQPPQIQQPYVSFQPQISYYIKPKIPGRGYGITSMVLGIIGIVYASIVLISAINSLDSYIVYSIDGYETVSHSSGNASYILSCFMYGILAILSTIFGIVSIAKGYKRGQSITGLVLGSCALLMIIAAIILFAVGQSSYEVYSYTNY